MVCGGSGFWYTRTSVIMPHSAHVAPSWRRQGIGGALHAWLEARQAELSSREDILGAIRKLVNRVSVEAAFFKELSLSCQPPSTSSRTSSPVSQPYERA